MNTQNMPEARRLDLIARASEKAVRLGCKMQVFERLDLTTLPVYVTLRRQQCAALDTLAALKIASR